MTTKPKKRTALSTANPRAWALFASGQSLRSIARDLRLDRQWLTVVAKREDWAGERQALRDRAAEKLSRQIERKLGDLKSVGLDARLLAVKRASKAMRRKRLDGDEAQALRDLSTVVRNSDLQSEAARRSEINIENKLGVGVSLAEMLTESRKLDLLAPHCEHGVIAWDCNRGGLACGEENWRRATVNERGEPQRFDVDAEDVKELAP